MTTGYGSRPPRRGRDHRDGSRRPSLNRPWVAPHGGGGRGQSRRDPPERAGTPTRDPAAPATRAEARGAVAARAGPAAGLGVHVVARAAARWPRQDADLARRGSGPRVHPVAGAAPVPQPVAESVPCLATAGRVCAGRSVVLSPHVAASADAIGRRGDRGHGDLAGGPTRPDRHARRPRAAAREGMGLSLDQVSPRANVRLAPSAAPRASGDAEGGPAHDARRRDVAHRH